MPRNPDNPVWSSELWQDAEKSVVLREYLNLPPTGPEFSYISPIARVGNITMVSTAWGTYVDYQNLIQSYQGESEIAEDDKKRLKTLTTLNFAGAFANQPDTNLYCEEYQENHAAYISQMLAMLAETREWSGFDVVGVGTVSTLPWAVEEGINRLARDGMGVGAVDMCVMACNSMTFLMDQYLQTYPKGTKIAIIGLESLQGSPIQTFNMLATFGNGGSGIAFEVGEIERLSGTPVRIGADPKSAISLPRCFQPNQIGNKLDCLGAGYWEVDPEASLLVRTQKGWFHHLPESEVASMGALALIAQFNVPVVDQIMWLLEQDVANDVQAHDSVLAHHPSAPVWLFQNAKLRERLQQAPHLPSFEMPWLLSDVPTNNVSSATWGKVAHTAAIRGLLRPGMISMNVGFGIGPSMQVNKTRWNG